MSMVLKPSKNSSCLCVKLSITYSTVKDSDLNSFSLVDFFQYGFKIIGLFLLESNIGSEKGMRYVFKVWRRCCYWLFFAFGCYRSQVFLKNNSQGFKKTYLYRSSAQFMQRKVRLIFLG
jgi:hypothetical protein